MLKDIDLKYKSGALTTTKNLTLSGSGSSLTVGNAAIVGGVRLSSPEPTHLGCKAWAYDPADVLGAGLTITDGVLYLIAVPVLSYDTISTLGYVQMNNATSPTSGANWIGLFDPSGNRVAQASLDTAVTAAGVKTLSVTPFAVTPGVYRGALLCNGTGTDPIGGCCNATGGTQEFSAQGFTSGATLRYAVNGSGLTTLPSSVTLASNTATGSKPYWFGIA